MKFELYRFGDLVVNFDRKRIPLSAKERANRQGKYRYYGAQGVIDYVDDYLFDGRYILIAEDGENLSSQKQNIAQIVEGKFWVNNHAHIVQCNEKCRLDYLEYAINSMDLSGYITGSAQPKLSQNNLNAVEIALPDLETQDAIISVIKPIDSKIEVNRAINHNLQQQVLALYRQMFVDSPNDNRKICRADEYFDISIGKTPPRKEPEWFKTIRTDNIVWVSIADMGNCGLFIGDSSEYLSPDAVKKFNVVTVPNNTVLLSFKLTVGRIAITDGQMTTNEAIAHFKTDNKAINE